MVYPQQIAVVILLFVVISFFLSRIFRKASFLFYSLLIIFLLYESIVFRNEFIIYRNEFLKIIGKYELNVNKSTIQLFDNKLNNNVQIGNYNDLQIEFYNNKSFRISKKTSLFTDTIGVWKFNFSNDRPTMLFNETNNMKQQFSASENGIYITGGFKENNIRYQYQLYFDRKNPN